MHVIFPNLTLQPMLQKGRSTKDLKNLRQECDIQRELNHPNIIRMIDSFDTDSELVVVTEYAEKELHSILAKEGCLNEEQVRKITWDLVSALYYLHSHRVLHRFVWFLYIYLLQPMPNVVANQACPGHGAWPASGRGHLTHNIDNNF